MASIAFHKSVGLWRVFWHCTLPDGSIDKGSKSFKIKKDAEDFKEHCERKTQQIKRAVYVEQVFLTDAADEWVNFCQSYTEATRKLYIAVSEKFFEFLPKNILYISDLSKFHINRYLNDLMGKGLANKTINNHMCAIKSLCLYIHENYNITNPADGIKKLSEDPAKANFLNNEEYTVVLNKCDDIGKPWIRFIANTGLRATEFCKLKWENIDFKNQTMTIVGKGRKRRTICLNDAAIKILEVRKAVKTCEYVFLRENKKPLSRHCLSKLIGKACRDAGLSGGGPHAFRHFFATQLLLGGVPIIKVSALLGHSSITTTQRHYSHILSKDLVGITSVLQGL